MRRLVLAVLSSYERDGSELESRGLRSDYVPLGSARW
jgi:hypothetical protein